MQPHVIAGYKNPARAIVKISLILYKFLIQTISIVYYVRIYVTGNVRNQALCTMPRQCEKFADCLIGLGNVHNAYAMCEIRTLPEPIRQCAQCLARQCTKFATKMFKISYYQGRLATN